MHSPQFRRHYPEIDPPTTSATGRFEGIVTNLLRRYGERVDNPNYRQKMEKLLVKKSVLVIEHDPDVMRIADYIVDIGPGAGRAGGQVVASGTPEEVAQVDASYTGRSLQPLIK